MSRRVPVGFCLAIVTLIPIAPLLAGTIHLKTGDLNTGDFRFSAAERSLKTLRPGRRHVMVEFAAPVTQRLLASLTARGAIVTNSLGRLALMLSVPESFDLRADGAAWSGPMRSTYKISPSRERQGVFYQGWVIAFHKDVPPADASKIIGESQFKIVPNRYLLKNELLVKGSAAELPKLAEWDEVAYIYPASKDLMEGLPVLACQGALSQGGPTPQFIAVGNGWAPNGSNLLNLSYVFTTLPSNLPSDQVQGEILRAMRQWSAAANVQFSEGENAAAPWTVAVEFGATVNNDPTPFDGEGLILAHTYYPAPPNPEPLAGDLHFNPAEDWHIGATPDIYTVALHEIGHALGLAHTDNPNDIMYPYYRFGAALSPDDIAGVQSLYGAPGSVPAGGGSPSAPAPLSISISGQNVAGSMVTLTGLVMNANGAATVTWQSSLGDSGQAMGGASWTISNAALSPGANTFTITATDSAQRTATATVQVQGPAAASSGPPTGSGSGAPSGTAAGSTAPVLTLISPQDGSSTTEGSATITGTAADPAGIASVTWQSNSGASGAALGATAWTVSGVPLFPGENIVVVRATNNSGIMRWISLTINKD